MKGSCTVALRFHTRSNTSRPKVTAMISGRLSTPGARAGAPTVVLPQSQDRSLWAWQSLRLGLFTHAFHGSNSLSLLAYSCDLLRKEKAACSIKPPHKALPKPRRLAIKCMCGYTYAVRIPRHFSTHAGKHTHRHTLTHRHTNAQTVSHIHTGATSQERNT